MCVCVRTVNTSSLEISTLKKKLNVGHWDFQRRQNYGVINIILRNKILWVRNDKSFKTVPLPSELLRARVQVLCGVSLFLFGLMPVHA